MPRHLFWTVILGLGLFANSRAENLSYVSYISKEHRVILSTWIKNQPQFRLATEADCNCADDLKEIRSAKVAGWPRRPKYVPYYVVGDFNHDGIDDFAVILLMRNADARDKVHVAVFNGVRGANQPSSTIVEVPLSVEGLGLFYGAPRPKPYRLIVGQFDSEGIAVLPTGTSYRLVYQKN